MASRGSRAKPLSHSGDGAAEATLVMAGCRCRVKLATALPRQLGYSVMFLPSPADDVTCTCKTTKLMHGVTMHATIFYICMYL
jgi:hypothetical protein